MAINKRLIKSNDEGAAGPSFNTVTYTGNASTLPITGVGFEPDFVWIKQRSYADSHNLWDRVRGLNNYLITNVTSAALSKTNGVTSLDTDGFTLGNWDTANTSGQNYVAWCWKAGGAAVTNTDGTITSQVSANTEAGFSIVSYTASGGGNYSVGHGLGQTPNFVIVKPRNENVGWTIWSSTFPNLTNSYINFTTMAVNTAGTVWGSGMTSTVIGQTSGATSNPNQPMIAYCFAEVAGFSKFGSYTGNGLPLGPTITTGFEPAFVMLKRTDSTSPWFMFDNKRNPTNNRNKILRANTSDAEGTGLSTEYVSFNADNFKLTSDPPSMNASGGTYIYMAFANQF